MSVDTAQVGGLGAGLFRAAALAEYPTLLELLDIYLATLLHRARLAGAVAVLQPIFALGDLRQRLAPDRPSLFGGPGAMPTYLNESSGSVGCSFIVERCSWVWKRL